MTACREWKDRLLETALGAPVHGEPVQGEPADARLAAHLRACAGCAAALEELAARRAQMDAAVRQLVGGAEPSPAFRARVLAAAETLPVTGAGQPAWLGALAAVAVMVLAGVLLQPPAPAPRPAPSLSEWRSPTDWLLRTPGDELLRSTPRVGDFYFPLESEKDSSQGGKNEG